MTKSELCKRIAYMEFVHDQLSAELEEIDTLLQHIGFPKGLQSARGVAIEMLNEGGEDEG